MGKKDIISKEIINTLVKDIAKYILGIEVGNLTLIDKEFQRVEDRRADVVANVDDEYILHIEIQNQNDKTMPIRMMRYFTDISFISELPIRQYLIYIGKTKLSMENFIKGVDFTYKYNIIDMKNINCEKFIELDTPDSLVLAVLCDFKDKDEQEVINYIIRRLKEKTKQNDVEFRKYMMMLEELSENRDLKDKIKKGEKMLTDFDYRKYPSFELGLEEGMQQGMQQGIMLGIKGVYMFEQNPKKIAKILDIDEKLVYSIIKEIKGKNDANVR